VTTWTRTCCRLHGLFWGGVRRSRQPLHRKAFCLYLRLSCRLPDRHGTQAASYLFCIPEQLWCVHMSAAGRPCEWNLIYEGHAGDWGLGICSLDGYRSPAVANAGFTPVLPFAGRSRVKRIHILPIGWTVKRRADGITHADSAGRGFENLAVDQWCAILGLLMLLLTSTRTSSNASPPKFRWHFWDSDTINSAKPPIELAGQDGGLCRCASSCLQTALEFGHDSFNPSNNAVAL
jgi:hypothetical protein